jgi:hypothetical protein
VYKTSKKNTITFAIINPIVTLGLNPGGWGFSSRNGSIDNLFD